MKMKNGFQDTTSYRPGFIGESIAVYFLTPGVNISHFHTFLLY